MWNESACVFLSLNDFFTISTCQSTFFYSLWLKQTTTLAWNCTLRILRNYILKYSLLQKNWYDFRSIVCNRLNDVIDSGQKCCGGSCSHRDPDGHPRPGGQNLLRRARSAANAQHRHKHQHLQKTLLYPFWESHQPRHESGSSSQTIFANRQKAYAISRRKSIVWS